MYSKLSIAGIQGKVFNEKGSYVIGYILWTMEETCNNSNNQYLYYIIFIFRHLSVY